jgi:hypothetical protein
MPMWRNVALACALLVLACGGGETPPPDEAADAAATEPENHAPLLESAYIAPREPTVGETIAVVVKVIDVDGDPVHLSVEWFRNQRSVKSGMSTSIDSSGFRRGDRIYARVTADDRSEQSTIDTEVVSIVNQLPTVTGVGIFPETPTGNDTLVVEALAEDGDGDALEYVYTWTINGQKLAGATGPSLEPGTVKRGDQVQVSVAASDGYGQGNWFRSKPRTIKNAPPVFKSDPSAGTVGAGRYKYPLKAEDPDGDRPLRYSLESGPPGLTVDLISGVVSWTVPEDAGGAYPIEVSVSDPYGGRSRQSYTLELHWESEPAEAE